MLYKEEKEKLEGLKKEEVELKDDFQKKSSLVLKISIFYLLLTITNLVIFWVAMGVNQMRLIKEKAILSSKSTSYELLRRLEPVIDDARWAKAIKKSDKKAQKKLKDSLRLSYSGQKKNAASQGMGIGETFQVVSKSSKIYYSEPKSKQKTVSGQIQRQVIDAIYRKNKRNQLFYSIPDIQNYNISIYIPLVSYGDEELVLISSLYMESIKDELFALFLLAAVMVVFMLVVQTLFGVLIYVTMIKPIKNLAGAAHAVGKGDLDVIVPIGKKSDELGQLIYLFNKMVASLKEKTIKLESTIEELEKHNEIMQNELNMAQSIQSGIMPDKSISDRISVGIYYGPLEKVSGDYYDIFPLPDGSVGVLITDASGHGVPAALVTIMAKMHFSSMAETYTTPGDLFEYVNRELARSITTSDYLTAFYLVIKPDLSVDYCNASHQKALIFHHETGEIEELDTGGFFIGAIEESPMPYETHNLQIKPKDRIILYTDGIVEGTNAASEEYGNDRFLDKIREYSSLSVDDFNDKIMVDVDGFAEGEPRKDDYTLFTIEIADSNVQTSELMKQGEKLYQSHDFSKARDIFSQILKVESANLGAKLFLANSLFFLKEYNNAIPYFEEYTQVKSTNPYAHLKLGVCYAKTGDENKALEEYQKSIQINQDLAEAYGQMAISYSNSGKLELATQHLDKALKLKPDDKRLHRIREKLEERAKSSKS